jgi:hypothetical protein
MESIWGPTIVGGGWVNGTPENPPKSAAQTAGRWLKAPAAAQEGC